MRIALQGWPSVLESRTAGAFIWEGEGAGTRPLACGPNGVTTPGQPKRTATEVASDEAFSGGGPGVPRPIPPALLSTRNFAMPETACAGRSSSAASATRKDRHDTPGHIHARVRVASRDAADCIHSNVAAPPAYQVGGPPSARIRRPHPCFMRCSSLILLRPQTPPIASFSPTRRLLGPRAWRRGVPLMTPQGPPSARPEAPAAAAPVEQPAPKDTLFTVRGAPPLASVRKVLPPLRKVTSLPEAQKQRPPTEAPAAAQPLPPPSPPPS